MKHVSFFGRVVLALSLGVIALANTIDAGAQVVLAPSKPVIGSSNTISADPPVARPDTRPCTVTLFTNLEFADFNTKNYTYTPPADCPGPWAKVVFTADFTVTAGRQFDRTEQFFLGGANLLYGTTAEPRSALSPDWHVENDVTDLSALLKTSQAGTALLGNFVGVSNGVDYTGIIYADAHLIFYPAGWFAPPARVPDVVIGLPGNNGAATLNTTTSQLTQVITLPTNVEAAYLDVIAQSQSNDEFWYLCVPNDVAGELQSCGSTGFRETEISIDGIPAGVAPVYPWIYTGGIDPELWEPIPGVQTLNFKPFRVDLTPFAGLLSNGQPHTVAISVFNADSYFLATATLLAYTDKGTEHVTGEVLSNTLAAAPTPSITENLATDASGNITGSVAVTSVRKYSILGKTRTSHGEVFTQVDGKLNFANTQSFVIDATEYKQSLVQSTEGTISTKTTTDGRTAVDEKILSYPFTFVYDQVQNSDGTFTVGSQSDQKYFVTRIDADPRHGFRGWGIPFIEQTSNEVISADDRFFDASGNPTGNAGSSSQNYVTLDSTGYCYSGSLKSKNLALTAFSYDSACKGRGDKR
jgi:peptide N-acetyl-beta-D-glucosaminyl asparaginase amidase A